VPETTEKSIIIIMYFSAVSANHFNLFILLRQLPDYHIKIAAPVNNQRKKGGEIHSAQ